MFKLDARLKQDLIYIKDLELSSLFILPDGELPWIVLVPKVNNISELFQLSSEQSELLMREIQSCSKLIASEFKVDKINVGSLGNMVKQLHIHIIGRYVSDRAWPGSIWGTNSGLDSQEIRNRIMKIFETN